MLVMCINRKSNNKLLVKWLARIFIFGAMTVSTKLTMAGSAPRTGVIGSFHDIAYMGRASGKYAQDDFQRTCIFCHTPHNAQPAGTLTPPLWNRVDTSNVNLVPYSWSAPANLAIGFNADDSLIGPSRLCMSCHDGVTAVDSHGPNSGVGTAQGNNNGNNRILAPGRYIDNLNNTHPIGFLYQDAYNDRGANELVDITTGAKFIDNVPDGAVGAGPDTRNRGSWTYTTNSISETLYSGYMTCASCHDPHNTNNAINDAPVSGGFAPNYFVWAKEKNSALCLSCHMK
jgi:hypothetical protein